MTNYNLAGDLDAAWASLRDKGGVRIVVAGDAYEIRLRLMDDDTPVLSLDDLRLLLDMEGSV